MIEQTETSVEVRRTVDVPAPDLFAVLSQPDRHTEIDGSGMLQGAVTTDVLTSPGQVFTMQMHYPSLGDYRTRNEVVSVTPGSEITWATARDGQPPAGVRWTWRLVPVEGGTEVVHRCDWSRVTDPAVLARVSFPRVSGEELEGTVDRLVAAATA